MRSFKIIVSISILLAACGGKKETESHWTSLPPATVASFTPGTTTVLAQATIDAAGGVLLGPAGSPLDGVAVTFPPGALTAATSFALGYDDGSFVNVSPDEQSGLVISIQSSGQTRFQQPVTIQLPFTDATRIPIPYYIDDSGALHVIVPQPFDRSTGQASFLTWHVSPYTLIKKDPAGNIQPTGAVFLPSVDGFAFSNTAPNQYAPDGRCWGISAFSLWYKSTQGGGLYSQFTGGVPTVIEGESSLTGQEIAATRAHNSISYFGNENQAPDVDQKTAILALQDALSKGAPGVVAGLWDIPHAVLAIGYDAHQIAIYDSNYPGTIQGINYTLDDPATHEATVSYGSSHILVAWGNGEVALNEDFQDILRDAQAGFNGENETKIDITSHTDGQEVDGTDVVLQGTIHSGQVLIDSLDVHVLYEDGTSPDPQHVDLSQGQSDFSVPLTLQQGANKISFVTRGYAAYRSYVEVPNDHRIQQPDCCFTLKTGEAAPLAKSSISVSMTRTTVVGDPNNPDEHDEETLAYSSNIVFHTYDMPTLLKSPNFDFGTCSEAAQDCQIIDAKSVSSYPYADATSNLPITVDYHLKVYTPDSNTGQLTLTSYRDATGTLDYQIVNLDVSVEPGSTAASYRYRVVAKTTGNLGIGTGGQTGSPVMVTGKSWDDTLGWVDDTPTPLQEIPSIESLDLEEAITDTCDTPPSLQAAAVEPWVSNSNKQTQTWSAVGSVRCQDSSGSRSEDANLSFTLVP